MSKEIRKQEKQGSATYIQLAKEIDNGNGVWKSFESISNLEERVYEKGEIVRNFVMGEYGCKYTSFGKSVLFRTQKNFEYKYGAGLRGENSENLGQNIYI